MVHSRRYARLDRRLCLHDRRDVKGQLESIFIANLAINVNNLVLKIAKIRHNLEINVAYK